MKSISILIKPVSSLCNMHCSYCFYCDVSNNRETKAYSIMDDDTLYKILDNIFVDLDKKDNITISFQGGEPTLAGVGYYKKLIDYVENIKNYQNINYSFQTNALLINNDWCNLFKKHNFLVGVSYDILDKVHNLYRKDSKDDNTSTKVKNSINLLKENEVEFNILSVLSNELAKHPNEVYEEIVKNDFQYVQFIPCLGDLNKKTIYEINPFSYYKFYDAIFNKWHDELNKGKYRSIKLFDDIINILAIQLQSACGMCGKCSKQIIVESNGNVYPCDFYALDRYCMGNLKEHSLSFFLNNKIADEFVAEKSDKHLCMNCLYKNICNGGCKRERPNTCFGIENQQCYYKSFLDKHLEDFINIIRNHSQ